MSRAQQIRQPAVSVVMPVHNVGNWVKDAVRSILGQSFSDIELIVVDDGSTDDTAAELSSVNDPRLRVINREKVGFIPALKEGILQARGNWIARMDGDDVVHPRKLEMQMRQLERSPDAVFCATGFGYISENGMLLRRPILFDQREITACMITRREKMFADATIVFHRKTALTAGLYDEDFQYNELSLWYRLLQRGRAMELGACLYFQRIHSGGMNIGRSDASKDALRVRRRYSTPEGCDEPESDGQYERDHRTVAWKGIRQKMRIFRAAGDIRAMAGLIFDTGKKLTVANSLRLVFFAISGREAFRWWKKDELPMKRRIRSYVPEDTESKNWFRHFGLRWKGTSQY